jgi:endonuclease/exonuclease/phosphatase family metal-dependent hydrolase
MIVFGIVFLFFFQLISEFVEGIYAFGLLGTGIPTEIVSVLLLFAPVLLSLLPKPLSGRGLALVACLALAASVAGMFLDTRARMLVTGFGTACALVYFPGRLWELGRDNASSSGSGMAVGLKLGAGLAGGLALFILFRAWNSGLYPYAESWFRVAAIILAIAGMVGLLRSPEKEPVQEEPVEEILPPPTGFWTTAGLSLGFSACLVMLYFAFANPNVIARWSEANYIVLLGLTVTSLAVFAAWLSGMPGRLLAFTPKMALFWNALFILVMTVAILPHQIRFPLDPQGYPFSEPVPGPLAYAALFATVVLFPVVLVNFVLLSAELATRRPSQRALGGGFTLGALFLLVMIFSHVFTTVYDYIPVVGPAFRDRFWLVYLILALVMALPLLLVRRVRSMNWRVLPRTVAWTVIGVGLAALIGAGFAAASPASPPEGRRDLVVMTYNIQQGYSETGSRAPQAQLQVMRQANADLIGLQESDTNRIAGGNADLVRYLADQLEMHSYYGPKVVPGTFGIALLSKYPIENPRTFYMYSEGEQTATIHAQVRVNGMLFNVFVTHLGNGGPIVQQEAILQELDGLENVIAMGDFNFRPDSEQYALTTQTLEDAWLLRWPSGIDDIGHNPDRRIDHVFLSPGLNVQEARFHTGPESDHPALIVELSW